MFLRCNWLHFLMIYALVQFSEKNWLFEKMKSCCANQSLLIWRAQRAHLKVFIFFFQSQPSSLSKPKKERVSPILNNDKGYFNIGPENQATHIFLFNIFICFGQNVQLVRIFSLISNPSKLEIALILKLIFLGPLASLFFYLFSTPFRHFQKMLKWMRVKVVRSCMICSVHILLQSRLHGNLSMNFNLRGPLPKSLQLLKNFWNSSQKKWKLFAFLFALQTMII